MAGQQVPLKISIAPFPEGFQGDMDETFQQGVQLMEATVAGNFLTGLVLPPGSTLPTSDQGPIAMGGVWYFFDPVSGQYLPQTVSSKVAKNFCRNSCYQVAQTGATFTPGIGVTATYDLATCRASGTTALTIAPDTGPAASTDNDYIPSSIRYTVGPSLVPSPVAADLYTHEHLIEGADIAMLQGEVLSLSFSIWTNTPGTYSAYLASGGRDCSYVANFTITTPSVWTRVKITAIPAIPTGTGTWRFGEGQTGLYIGVAMLVGTQWRTATPNTWQPAFVAGTASNINMLTVVNNQLKVTGVKLEASPGVSYLSVPAFDTDIWDCIRYYFTNFTYQSTTVGVPLILVASGTTAAYGSLLFPRRMCKSPNVVPYSSNSKVPGTVYDINSAADISVATLPSTTKGTGGAVTITGNKGDLLGCYLIADSRLT